MKLKTDLKEYESINAESKVFSVDTDDTMVIRLLRDKMYKNKVGAVCREIASNSRDANRESGRGDIPIVIKIIKDTSLLSNTELSISFTDRGIGISPDRMGKIFLKYGSSTKRDTDKFTGGFGIGAKTPFAYTDNFLITTIVEENGVRTKYYYQAAITGDGKKEITRMIDLGNEPTTENTGTAITVPLKKQEDLSKFEKEVIYATSLWKVKPQLIGFETKSELKVVYENDKFSIVFDKECKLFGSHKHIALIDGIPYVLDVDKFQDKKNFASLRTSLKWVTKHGVEDVTVSGSREDIEYTQENEKTIIEAIANNILKTGKVLVEEILLNVSTYKEACMSSNLLKTVGDSFGILNENILNRFYFIDDKFKDVHFMSFLGSILQETNSKEEIYSEDFSDMKRVSSPKLSNYEINPYLSDWGNRVKKNHSIRYANIEDPRWSLPMYIMDLGKTEPTRQATLKNLHPDGYVIIQISKANGGRDSFVEEQNNIELAKFNIVPKMYSDVEKTRKVKDGTRNVTDIVNVQCRVFKKTRPRWTTYSWDSLPVSYDKSNHSFVNILNSVNAVLNVDEMPIVSVCYYAQPKLDKFNDSNHTTGPNGVAGMSKSQNAFRELLYSLGIVTIGVGESKSKYFQEAGVKTFEQAIRDVINSEVAGDKIKDAMKHIIIKDSGILNDIFETIKLDDEIKTSYNFLCKTFKTVSKELKEDENLKTISTLLSKVNSSYAEEIGLSIDKKFDDNYKNFINYFNENLMLKFIIKHTKGGQNQVWFNQDSDEFQSAIKDYINKLND